MRVRLATGFCMRARGLLLRRRGWLGCDGVLLLAPCRSVHTIGMRHEIDIAFVGGDGGVLRSERKVRPLRMLSCSGAVAVLERFSPLPGDGNVCFDDDWPKVGDVIDLVASHAADNEPNDDCEPKRARWKHDWS